jgi:hypothetical protein
MRGPHDVGGEAAGPIDWSTHALSPLEKRIDSLVRRLVLQADPIISLDEMRRMMESVTHDDYREMSYYERWLRALKDLAIEKNLLTELEVQERITELSLKTIKKISS